MIIILYLYKFIEPVTVAEHNLKNIVQDFVEKRIYHEI